VLEAKEAKITEGPKFGTSRRYWMEELPWRTRKRCVLKKGIAKWHKIIL